MHPLLRFFRSSSSIIKIGYLMTRFITMPIPSVIKHLVSRAITFSLRTGISPFFSIFFRLFYLFFLLIHRFAVSDYLEQTFRVLRNIPGIMTGSTLGDVTLAVHQVFIILPLAILVSAICPSCSRIDDIAPVLERRIRSL